MHVNAFAAHRLFMQRYPLHFLMRVDQEFLDAIDAWRRGQADLPPRAEALRRLVTIALKSESPKEPSDKD